MKKIIGITITVIVLLLSLCASACGGSASTTRSGPASTGSGAAPGQDKPSGGGATAEADDGSALRTIRIPFDQNTSVDLRWGWDLFDRDASEYSHDLAMAAIVLSQAVEMGREAAEERMGQLGFGNPDSFWYGGNDDNIYMPATTLASQLVRIGGEEKVLIVVSVRGTTDTGDWISNAFSQIDGFTNAADNVNDMFRAYYDTLSAKYSVTLTQDNTVFFFTGHSQGGAVAGLMGHMAEDIGYRSNIFVYTFASPNYMTADLYPEQYGNHHNIINTADIVPYVPLGFTRFGHDWYYTMDRANVVQNHILSTYLKCMIMGLPSNMGPGAENGYDWESYHYLDDTDVSLVGTWQSVGSTGFGQAQPGAIIRFDESTCNFYSPNDTYELYEVEGRVYLQCTSVLTASTLTFRVDASDPDRVIITYADTVTTLQRVSAAGDAGGGGQNGGTSWGDDQPTDGSGNGGTSWGDGQPTDGGQSGGGIVSGGVPSGDYYSTDGFNQVFTFHDDGTITMQAFGISADGTYTIGNGTITIHYNFLGDQVWSPSFSMSGNSIWIAGTEFVRR